MPLPRRPPNARCPLPQEHDAYADIAKEFTDEARNLVQQCWLKCSGFNTDTNQRPRPENCRHPRYLPAPLAHDTSARRSFGGDEARPGPVLRVLPGPLPPPKNTRCRVAFASMEHVGTSFNVTANVWSLRNACVAHCKEVCEMEKYQ